MSCRRIEQLDLAAFLDDPGASEFDDFRSHYPGCRDCAAEIRVWTELDLGLEAEADAHPSVEELLRLQDDPASLSPEARARLASHLASCASCEEEARAVETFAPAHRTGEIAAMRALKPDERRTDASPAFEPDSERRAGAAFGPDSKRGIRAAFEPDSKRGAGAAFEPDSERGIRAELEPDPELGAESRPDDRAKPESDAESEFESEVESVLESVAKAVESESPSPGGPRATFSGAAPPPSRRAKLGREPERTEPSTPGWGRRVARVVWSPAFAYAALLLVTLPLVLSRRDVVIEPIRPSLRAPAPPESPASGERVADASSGEAEPALQAAGEMRSRLEEEMVVLSMEARPPDQGVAPPIPRPSMRDRPRGASEALPEARRAILPGRRVLPAERNGGTLIVNVPPSPRFAGADHVEIVVTTPAGRELRQPVATDPASSLRLVLPEDWLASETLELQIRDDRGQIETYAVTVAPRG